MSTERNTSGVFALFLFLDFTFVNNFKKNTENASILSVRSMFYTTHTPCRGNRCTVDNFRYLINVEIL